MSASRREGQAHELDLLVDFLTFYKVPIFVGCLEGRMCLHYAGGFLQNANICTDIVFIAMKLDS